MNEKLGFGYYIVIPTNLLMDEKVSPNAKLCFGVIANLANQRGYCFASNKYIADLMDVHEMTISKYVSELIKGGYLNKFDEMINNGMQRRLVISDPLNLDPPKQNDLGGSAKSIRGGNENQLGGVSEITYHNNIRLISKDEYSKINIIQGEFFDQESNDAWNQWIAYRKEKRKPVTGQTRERQIRLLHNLTPQERIATINQSITQGWTGLFEVKTFKKQQKNDLSSDVAAALSKLADNC